LKTQNSSSKQCAFLKKIAYLSLFFIYAFQIPETASINQEVINLLKKEVSPKKRAVTLLLQIKKISATTPQQLKPTYEAAKKLFPINSSLNSPVLLLAELEIAYLEGSYEDAKRKNLKVIKLLEEQPIKDKEIQKLLCLSYLQFAKVSKFIHTEKEGLLYAFKALELAKDINFSLGKFFSHNHIGILNESLTNNYHFSLNHYLKAQAIIPQLPSSFQKYLRLAILNNLAINWSKDGQIEKSINYRLDLLKELEITQNIPLTIATTNNLGANYFKLEKYDLSEKYLLETLALMEQYQQESKKGIPLKKLSLIKIETEQLAEAKSYVDEIDKWLTKHKFEGRQEVLYYLLKCKLAKALGNYKEGISWLEKASNAQEILDKTANTISFVNLEVKSEFSELRQSIELLKQEKDINAKIIFSQNIQLLIVSLLSILSILFALIVHRKNNDLREAYDFILTGKENIFYAASTKSSASDIKAIDKDLMKKIIYALQEEKVFLDSDLSLKKFADYINSNTSYVSKTINAGFDKNFNSLINEYRIKEILSYFQNKQNEIYTIEALYLKAGFKSKSTFQNAFKKSIGVTASHYLKTFRKNKKLNADEH